MNSEAEALANGSGQPGGNGLPGPGQTRGTGAGADALAIVTAPAASEALPLTPVQVAMIYERLAAGRAGVNTEQIILGLDWHEDRLPALQSAWDRAFRRHQGLRMRLVWGEDLPLQSPVDASWSPQIRLKEFSADADPEAMFQAWAAALRAAGTDDGIANGPSVPASGAVPGSQSDVAEARSGAGDPAADAPPGLYRLDLARLSPGEAALVWTFSHVLLDGRGFTLVLREVLADFAALIAGEALPDRPEAPDPAPHFQAAALAAADPLAPQGAARAEGPVAQEAALLPEPGFLPVADPALLPAALSNRILTTALGEAETTRLQDLAKHCGVTIFTMVNAAWGLMLARASGQAQAVFGSTRSGRSLTPESRDLVGCLITTSPLRTVVTPGESLAVFLQRLRGEELALRQQAHLPAAALRPGAGGGSPAQPHAPLFETLVVCEREPLSAILRREAGDMVSRVILREEGGLALTLAAYGGPALQLQLEYDPRKISAALGTQCLAWTEALLLALSAANPAQPLAALQMITPGEEEALARLAAPDTPLAPPLRPPEERISERARSQPDAVAAVCEGEELSFGALEAGAERLAAALIGRGLIPGQVVAFLLPRGQLYLQALLAVWKAGAAFLPLDPSWPEARLRYMIEDSGAVLLLTPAAGTPGNSPASETPGLAPGELAISGLPVLSLPLEGEVAPARARHLPGPEDPAYLLYTSGSTGQPKGVAVPRRAIAAHAGAALQLFGLTAADRVLQFTSLSFDVSLEEVLPTLIAGARVVFRSEEAAQDPRALLAQITAAGITVLNLPTGYWQALLEELEQGGLQLPASVRLVISGGERVPPGAVARWQALLPDRAWINGYGPTEATITSAAFTLAPGAALPQGDVPVGRPLGHARLYVLAADGSLAPPGVPGRLWIGGAAVASGYPREAALTRARFAPDPFLSQPGARIYDSGDLAQWGSDGELRLLGRADRQLKLRGFRIEPGEIEAALEAVAGVTRALVGLRGENASARLIAWISTGEGLAPGDLSEPLSAALLALPAPLRPQIALVADWPMTPGGKIDLALLPDPEAGGAGLGQVADPLAGGPADALTLRLAGEFAQVLGRRAFGPDEDFFEAGGHSLLLIRLIAGIEAREGQRLGVADLRQNPSPRRLAALLASDRAAAGQGPGGTDRDYLLPIQPAGSRIPIYGVHVLGINGSYYRPLSAALGPDQPLFGLTVGLLNDETPVSVEETSALYQRVIEAHQPEGKLALMAVSLGAYIAFDLARRLRESGREVQMLALIDASGPGGRPSVGLLVRLGRHFGNLRGEGLGYLRRKLGERGEALQHNLAKLRLLLGQRFGPKDSTGTASPGRAAASVQDFVAANALAINSYEPQPYEGRLTVFRARDNIFDSPEALVSGLGWAPVAAGGVDLHDIEGDHLSLLQEPGVDHLAAHIRRILGDGGDRGAGPVSGSEASGDPAAGAAPEAKS